MVTRHEAGSDGLQSSATMTHSHMPANLLDPRSADFAGHIPLLVVGGGGCGLTAALAAQQAGTDVLVLERDSSALGTTAMSTGLIPAAGTRRLKKYISRPPSTNLQEIVAKYRIQGLSHQPGLLPQEPFAPLVT